MVVATKRPPRLTEEERDLLDRLISLHQTDGASEAAPIDRDFLLMDGNYDLFFLHYFPDSFVQFEPLNYQFIDFLENEQRGMAWLPAQHGKTTSLLHWMIYVLCREPDISIIYCEKSEPAAHQRARTIMDILEFNKKLVHDFGEFKSRWWSVEALVIKQRTKLVQWPSIAFYGAQSKATLGSRCNIMIVDDPVTAENSASELERARLREWFFQAAATCPYPLPVERERYLRKLFLVGTTFHMDDLYHSVLKTGMYKHLWLKAVDLKTGETLSPRFTYRTTEELEREAEHDPEAAKLLENVKAGRVTSLGDWRKANDTRSFMRRYQNEVRDDSTSKFAEIWFRGGEDDWAPPGGYPGCLEDHEHHPGRSLGEKPNTKTLTCITGVDPAAGTKGHYTVRFACVTLGCDLVHDPNTVYLIDLDYGQQPMVSDNPNKESQLDIVLRHVERYNSRVVLETNNVQSVWAQALRQEAQRRGMNVLITGHHTSHQKRVDPEQGIEAMAPMVENGHLRLPYKLPSDKRRVDELIDEFIYWGSFPTDDILMAFWFAWRALERKRRSRAVSAPVKRELPPYFLTGDKWNFPPHWTDEQKARFLGLLPPSEAEDE